MRKDRPNITFDELRDKICQYISDPNELDLIRKAYKLKKID